MGDHDERLEEILAELSDPADQWDTHTVDLSGVYSNVSITSPYTATMTVPNTVFATSSTGINTPVSYTHLTLPTILRV